MKKISLFCFFFIISCSTFAQNPNRVAFVDIDYILENLPEYQIANKQFEQKVESWMHEIDEKQNQIQKQKQILEAEKPLLSAQSIKDRQEEIQIMENNLKALWQKRFAPETGDYTQQMWQLVQPIENQIFNIAQEIGKIKKYDYIFTKDDIGVVYSEQKHDITRVVLRLIKRKDNPEDRNKDLGALIRDDFDLKDDIERKREENKKQQEQELQKRQAERESKKQEMLSERQQKLKERQQAREKALQERLEAREKARKERQEKQEQLKKKKN